MRPPCNPGMTDSYSEVDISASRLQIKLIFSGTIKETCILNSNMKVIQAVKSGLIQKRKTFHQRGPHVSTYSTSKIHLSDNDISQYSIIDNKPINRFLQ